MFPSHAQGLDVVSNMFHNKRNMRVGMPIIEHRPMIDQGKSSDMAAQCTLTTLLVCILHSMTGHVVWKFCDWFFCYNLHLSILFCVQPWDKFRTIGCYLHHTLNENMFNDGSGSLR